jgi:hypothetical protein
MSQRHLVRAALAAVVVLGIAACGTDRGDDPTARVVQGVVQLLRPAAPPPPVTRQQIDQVLASTDSAVALVEVEQRSQQAIIVEIERNGPYVTYGTGDRRTLTFRDGILTATRGLGGDLMSTDAPGIRALIRNRESGSATRTMRFLDGEDLIEQYDLTCTINRGAEEKLPGGAQALRLTETCTYEGATLTNSYLVDRKGHVLASRQWAGRFSGHLSIRQLRF